jgi:hypothetical protein
MSEVIKITLEREELNLIVDALSKEPFRKVYKLIEKIHVQSNAQLNPNFLKENDNQNL